MVASKQADLPANLQTPSQHHLAYSKPVAYVVRVQHARGNSSQKHVPRPRALLSDLMTTQLVEGVFWPRSIEYDVLVPSICPRAASMSMNRGRRGR